MHLSPEESRPALRGSSSCRPAAATFTASPRQPASPDHPQSGLDSISSMISCFAALEWDLLKQLLARSGSARQARPKRAHVDQDICTLLLQQEGAHAQRHQFASLQRAPQRRGTDDRASDGLHPSCILHSTLLTPTILVILCSILNNLSSNSSKFLPKLLIT